MEKVDLIVQQEAALKEFKQDSTIIGRQTEDYLRLVYPAYLVDPDNIEGLLDKNSTIQLDSMTFFRISVCTADTVDKLFETVNTKIEKLLTALHSIGVSIAYGLVSRDGTANLVLGVYSKGDVKTVETITLGMLSGIEMEQFKPEFGTPSAKPTNYGILSGVPSLYLREEKQTFSLSSIMRSLNGSEYTLLFIAKPVPVEIVTENIAELISVRDEAFSVSKRNIARSRSYAETTTDTNSVNDGKNSTAGQVGGGTGAALGLGAGAVIGTFLLPGLGTAAGAAIGGAGGGGLGSVIGSIVGRGKTHSVGYSDSISEAITNGGTVSGEIQNGFALELMNYADKAINRLKSGYANGVWQMSIAYSADSAISRDIIKACLCGELSKPDPDKLPLLAFEPCAVTGEKLRIPSFLGCDKQNFLCSYVTSAELGLLCTVPTESVPDFELRIQKEYPMIRTSASPGSVTIGNVTDGKRVLKNMPFVLSQLDLNKHTFVCGITGSGKTTTVKKILIEAQIPFLVIESAKKEYRNIAADTTVFTLGKPEINCPQINPFYIMPGVSLQTHIDYLKDLFNASFSFYGPMPYILEKCLYTAYRNKGWDLTLGYHPFLTNSQSQVEFFSIDHARKQYGCVSHKYLFPTMQELKNEIARYIEEELKYDGEVAGNVKTAMKVRLENLCVGAKGFAFNTHECPDFSNLLQKNVVFELEGLADDSDKAFSVGLLIIFINEYRQVIKELCGNKGTELEHLLVIEEAHRLLKNVDTDRSTEETGNPAGKAVEHFTNMLAEMRSYGQGVIVAEQIPSKLAPDVIKNSSTKIVQRVVAADDQKIIANTIGISADDALQLGTFETGYAFCHKEGMALPTSVKIADTYIDDDGNCRDLDVFVSDEELYNLNKDCFLKINRSILQGVLGNEELAKGDVLALLNTILAESIENGVTSCESISRKFAGILIQKNVSLVLCHDIQSVIAECITEVMLCLLLNGVYAVKYLPPDSFVLSLKEMLCYPSADTVQKVKNEFAKLYGQDVTKFAKRIIVELIKLTQKRNTDIPGTVSAYFATVSNETIDELVTVIKGRETL